MCQQGILQGWQWFLQPQRGCGLRDRRHDRHAHLPHQHGRHDHPQRDRLPHRDHRGPLQQKKCCVRRIQREFLHRQRVLLRQQVQRLRTALRKESRTNWIRGEIHSQV